MGRGRMGDSMKRTTKLVIAVAFCATLVVGLCVCLAGCGGKEPDLKNLRELSWEGTELTVKVGENKDTGCVWKNKFEDDSIIDYSVNRKFTLSDSGAAKGQSVGTLSMGFKGKKEGTARVYCITPKDWDGNKPGYNLAIVVKVKADGTIESAEWE